MHIFVQGRRITALLNDGGVKKISNKMQHEKLSTCTKTVKEKSIGIPVKCLKCGREWNFKGTGIRATCPDCNKTFNAKSKV